MLLTVTVCAVAAGARSFVAIAEWVADLPAALADTLGTGSGARGVHDPPHRARRVDADLFDTVIGGFVQRLCAARAPAGRRRVLAVDGKTLRGSRHATATGGSRPAPARGDRPTHPRRTFGKTTLLARWLEAA